MTYKLELLYNRTCIQSYYDSEPTKCVSQLTAKMYRQIVVHPQDRDLQRILWRYSPDEPIQEYRLTTVTYGTSSAPFLATRCLKKLADNNDQQNPRATHVTKMSSMLMIY
jgi:hypothetical protein